MFGFVSAYNAQILEFCLDIDRYKLDIKVVHKQGSAKFVFWDHQCAEIIGMTALELRDRMLQVFSRFLKIEIISLHIPFLCLKVLLFGY